MKIIKVYESLLREAFLLYMIVIGHLYAIGKQRRNIIFFLRK